MKAKVMSFFLILSVISTVFAFKIWENSSDNSSFNSIVELSQSSKILTQTLSSPEGKRLVPEGAILGVNDVTEITYQYLCNLEDDHYLEVAVENIYLTKNNQYYFDEYGLLSFVFDIDEIDNGQSIVTLTIKLNMPQNQEQYDLIKNSKVSFDVQFNQIPMLNYN